MDWSPIEFFIEGKRSRTGKSLHPKFGMMSIIMNPYFEKKVPDLTIVPISISYEKVLEAELYSSELMGGKKVKESLQGLIKWVSSSWKFKLKIQSLEKSRLEKFEWFELKIFIEVIQVETWCWFKIRSSSWELFIFQLEFNLNPGLPRSCRWTLVESTSSSTIPSPPKSLSPNNPYPREWIPSPTNNTEDK